MIKTTIFALLLGCVSIFSTVQAGQVGLSLDENTTLSMDENTTLSMDENTTLNADESGTPSSYTISPAVIDYADGGWDLFDVPTTH
ncbi:MAG: hypothetical protein SGJ20_00330 [Planctomycetota bacterium]|nr:hypothetical protein [Planctomycetota bacterium]